MPLDITPANKVNLFKIHGTSRLGLHIVSGT